MCIRGLPGWPGRASHKEGEAWWIIAKLSSASILRSCVMQMAIAEAGRRGEVRYFGAADASEAANRKLVVKLAARYSTLAFSYEADPTG